MTDEPKTDLDALCERLEALHVWPQFVADDHADLLRPRQIEGLYAVGTVAHEAAETIRSLAGLLREAEEALEAVASPYHYRREECRDIARTALTKLRNAL